MKGKKYVKYGDAPSVLRFQALNEVAKRAFKAKVEQERQIAQAKPQPKQQGKSKTFERRKRQQTFIQDHLATHISMETEEEGKDGIRNNNKRPNANEEEAKGASKSARTHEQVYKNKEEEGLQPPLPAGEGAGVEVAS